MTTEEFRSHKYLPQQWRKELETNGLLRLVLQVMNENGPDNFTVGRDGNDDISPTRAAIELGVTRGYKKYEARLKLLATRIEKAKDVGEPTYQKEEKENA